MSFLSKHQKPKPKDTPFIILCDEEKHQILIFEKLETDNVSGISHLELLKRIS